MKNVKWLGYMFMVCAGSAQLTASSTPESAIEWSQDQIVCLSDLDEQTLQEFSSGEFGGLIIECAEGVTLPFKIVLKGEFLSLDSTESADLYMDVLKTCYVRCEERGKFLFSSDLNNWEEFAQFFTGELRVSVEIEDGEPVAGLQLELNQRTN